MEQQTAASGQVESNIENEDDDFFGVLPQSIKTVLTEDWKRVIGITLLVALIAAAWSYTITPMYKATVVVQVKGKASRGGGTSPLADLALAAGMPVLADETADAAIGKLKSTTFSRSFIEKEKLIDSLLPDEGLFAGFRFTIPWLMPSAAQKGLSDEFRKLESARVIFSKRILITEERKTQLLTLVLYWDDPARAAELANKMIRQVNEYMRRQAVENAEKSITYLNMELSKTSLVPVQQAIYRLLEEQVKTQMTAGISEEFALRFIDPASPPNQRDSPKRKIIASIAALLGFVLTTALLVWRKRTASVG